MSYVLKRPEEMYERTKITTAKTIFTNEVLAGIAIYFCKTKKCEEIHVKGITSNYDETMKEPHINQSWIHESIGLLNNFANPAVDSDRIQECI